MTGDLDKALTLLLREALDGLLGGATPDVQLAVLAGPFEIDPASTDAEAGQPRSAEASDDLPFNPLSAPGPYQLTRLPDTSVRKVRLTTAAGDLIPISDSEVNFDALDTRKFSLSLRPSRDLTAVTGLRVLYGVTAVYAQVKYTQTLRLELASDKPVPLARAQALAMAVLALNRQRLMATGGRNEHTSAYSADITVKDLHFLGGDQASADKRSIALRAEFELKAARALGDGEGAPIRHIVSAGSSGGRAVDIQIQVGA